MLTINKHFTQFLPGTLSKNIVTKHLKTLSQFIKYHVGWHRSCFEVLPEYLSLTLS